MPNEGRKLLLDGSEVDFVRRTDDERANPMEIDVRLVFFSRIHWTSRPIAFVQLKSCFNTLNIDCWFHFLESQKLISRVDCLIDWHKRIFTDLKRAIQIYSLVENVLRNVLCRRYIPSYGTIDKYCNLYRCFVQPNDEQYLLSLGFKRQGEHRLTYEENEPRATVVQALTCCVLWFHCVTELEHSERRHPS
jgi:hypothetical protein